ncbi:MAG TPA: pseudouridine synthase [Pyrinomonadaceae bacterium]|nr:pseudouridine synthase [Pyrinomonadaceae bacterium]
MKSPLPIVEGVGPSRQWLPAGRWKTVLDFLRERFPDVETATWLTRMEKGQVLDEAGLRINAGSAYRVGACIFYYRELESETIIPFVESVLYRDEHILVADKPHFLPVVPSGRFLHETLLVRLKKKEGLEHLVPIHRIDRETAGVVLFSLNPATRGLYASLFHDRKVEKTYEAFARTLPRLEFPLTRRSRIERGEPFFRMKEIEGEPNSETHIDVVEHMSDATLYRLIPVTGRKHQLRLHLSALGIPIVNDRLYPEVSFVGEDDFSNPLKLLAKSVCFRDPLTGRECYFESVGKL